LCCLGQAVVTMKEFYGINPISKFINQEEGRILFDERSDTELDKSWKELGLYDCDGGFRNRESIKPYASLVQMNDEGATWPEIADFIEENPEIVFTESK